MQVKVLTNSDLSASARKSKGKRSNRASGSAANTRTDSFQSLLEEVLPSQGTQAKELNQLWQDLPQTEQDLLDHPSNQNLYKYRQLVFEIARGVLATNIKTVQLNRKSRFNAAEKIPLTLHLFLDQRLKKMAEAILSPQIPAFYLLKTTTEIRGILLDYRK